MPGSRSEGTAEGTTGSFHLRAHLCTLHVPRAQKVTVGSYPLYSLYPLIFGGSECPAIIESPFLAS